MSQNLQNFVKFQKFQLENLVDFEKCCKTHIFLQKSEPIQPKTSNILPKFCQKPATTLRALVAAALRHAVDRAAEAAVRSGLNNLFIFSKLREARSWLYRRQLLQVNIRWKALDEIYKICMHLHRSDLNISAKIRQSCWRFQHWKC